MNRRGRLRSGVAAVLGLMLFGGAAALAQRPVAAAIQEQLAGRPLYLRGAWASDQLEFDGAGKPLGKAQAGPFTRSGIDVRSVSASGKNLVVHGQRVALASGNDGRLERRLLGSSTSINPLFHLKHPKIFVAGEEMTLVVHPDEAGSFAAPLKEIFVDGLAELAKVVPPYWSCYAEGYFVPDRSREEAEQVVAECVRRRSLVGVGDRSGSGMTTPPTLAGVNLDRQGAMDASLPLSGVVAIHMTVTRTGVPAGLQMVRAVGAGVDEQVLRMAYDLHFTPATRDGRPVASEFEYTLRVGSER